MKESNKNTQNNNRKGLNIARYVFGMIIILGSMQDFPKIYCFVGILFGLSLLPISYEKLSIYIKNKNIIKKSSVIIPILLMIVWSYMLPNQNDNYNGQDDNRQNISEEKDKFDQEDIKDDEFEIILDKNSISINIGEIVDIDYKLSNNINIEKEIWESSNTKVATVEKGKIKGISSGKTTISLTINQKTTKIVVNVIKPKYDIEDSLTNIALTYYQNEARGNSNYFGKNIKLTAQIYDIDVDDSVLFNIGVTIWLKEDGAKYNLSCNNEDGISGITKYNKGDFITVIGKMNTMSGRTLRLDNCEISK